MAGVVAKERRDCLACACARVVLMLDLCFTMVSGPPWVRRWVDVVKMKKNEGSIILGFG